MVWLYLGLPTMVRWGKGYIGHDTDMSVNQKKTEGLKQGPTDQRVPVQDQRTGPTTDRKTKNPRPLNNRLVKFVADLGRFSVIFETKSKFWVTFSRMMFRNAEIPMFRCNSGFCGMFSDVLTHLDPVSDIEIPRMPISIIRSRSKCSFSPGKFIFWSKKWRF